MNKIFLIAVGILSANAHAGFQSLSCEAFRVSKDANENIQTFSVKENVVKLNDVVLNDEDLVSGSLYDLYAGYVEKAVYKSKDAKGDYSIEVSVLAPVTAVEGRLSVGRGHEVNVYKTLVKASRNGKTHEFTGTCRTELVTTCGGECADEDPNRDEL